MKEETNPPIKKFQIRGFHTQSMESWLKEPIPVMSGQQPSSGFQLVAMPCSDISVIPHLIEEHTRSFNAGLGLPTFERLYASESSGACGMFLRSDGSYGSSLSLSLSLCTL